MIKKGTAVNGIVRYEDGTTWVDVRDNFTIGDKLNFKKWTRGKYRFKGDEVIEQVEDKPITETTEFKIFTNFAVAWGEKEALTPANILKNEAILDIFDKVVEDISNRLNGKKDDEQGNLTK